MATVKQLAENKDIKYIRNKNAPPGVYIEIIREKEQPVTLITHFPTGNKHVQIYTDRNNFVVDTNDKWEAIAEKDIEAFKKGGVDFINKGKLIREDKNIKAELNEVPNQVKEEPKVTIVPEAPPKRAPAKIVT